MVDIFKKKEIDSLKTRISALEEENRKLMVQLEKRDDKTRRTIAAKQEVDRELNEYRQKISSLENELKKIKENTPSELKFRFSGTFTRNRLDELIYLLGSCEAKKSSLVSIYLPEKDSFEKIAGEARIDNETLYLIQKIESSTGKVIFYDTENLVRIAIVPVFPVQVPGCSIDRKFNIEPLGTCLKSEKILVVNAHAGETFVGIAENDDFVQHNIIRSSVMGKHSRGGFSQKRFERLIEEDIRHHADKVRSSLEGMVEMNRDIKYIVAGGEGKLLNYILDGYDYPLIMKNLEPVMKKNVDQVLKEVMATRVYGI